MDLINDDQVLAILGRSDFVGGIDNEALDFSQLEAFINSEGAAAGYFTESLVLTPNKKTDAVLPSITSGPHRLPESPPDSGSEHPPYSPGDDITAAGVVTSLHYITAGAGATAAPPPVGSYVAVLPPHEALATPAVYRDGAAELGTIVYPTVLPSMVPNEPIVYADLQTSAQLQQQASKKRKLSTGSSDAVNSPAGSTVGSNCRIKPEPAPVPSLPVPSLSPAPLVTSLPHPERCTTADSNGTSATGGDSGSFQCIRFSSFQPADWHVLCDQTLTELPVPHYRVDADKGFNFSNSDDAFVCQKKNHFQITCHAQLQGDAQFVKTSEGLKKISSFHLHFYGVKVESPGQTIKVEQSQSDRSKKPFHPVLVELQCEQVTKVTVGRLHFSETTSNNMRKKGKPNPDQRYFRLAVGLHAHTLHSGDYPVVTHASERIIVRASNPGQFESDVELCWQRGQVQDSIFHAGKVGINTDRPDETLVVHGNVKVSGHIVQPSDVRAKQNISELDTAQQLKNMQQIRVVSYSYHPEFAVHSGLDGETDTGVIAQEVQQVIPDAVTKAGDILLPSGHVIDNFLVVNKDRIYMENIGAVKELCKVTDSLETRIDQLERVNLRLTKIKLKRNDSVQSNTNSTMITSRYRNCTSCQHTRHRFKHVHKHLSDDTDEICSNKLIQIVIVILILIMASCLAAISTLYFLERSSATRQQQQQVYDSYPGNRGGRPWPLTLSPRGPTNAATSQSSGYRRTQLGKDPHHQVSDYQADISNFIDVIKNTLLNQMQGKSPKLPYTMKSQPSYDNLQTIGVTSDSEGLVFRENYQRSWNSFSRILTVPTLDTPTHCLQLSEYGQANCQAFCCAPRQVAYETPELSSSERLGEKSQDYLAIKHNTTYSIEIINDAKNLIPKHNSSSLYSSENLAKINKHTINGVKRDRRQIKPVPEDLENCEQISVSISTSTLNATLGSELVCLHNIKMLNITYNIPLSKYSTAAEFVLTFTSRQTKLLFLCRRRDVKNKDCSTSLLDQDRSRHFHTEDGRTFNIEMSGYYSRNLTYRAPITGPFNMDICSLSGNTRGEFLEYNMNFYRDCQE